MTIFDDMQRMKREGRSDSEIVQLLSQRGYPVQEIENALSQSQIKEAVAGSLQVPSPSNEELYPSQEFTPSEQNAPEYPPQNTYPSQFPSQDYQQPYPQGNYGAQQYPQQDQYAYDNQSPYQSALSSDTISEIAEQVVAEKLAKIKTQIEKAIDAKTTAEVKLASMQDRVERLEKIMDQLQISILQKVGEYMNDASNLKKELEETQKSFTTLVNKRTSPHPHKHEHPHPAHEHHQHTHHERLHQSHEHNPHHETHHHNEKKVKHKK